NAGSCVEVDFTAFDIENGFDFLSIYDGPNTAGALIGTFTGTSSPGTVTSATGCLTFVFQSDGSVTGPGWAANVNCVNCQCLPNMNTCVDSVCTGDFFDSGGSTANYGSNESLVHTICADNGQCTQVVFSSFDIEDGFDFLNVYDGPSTASPLLGSFTGTVSPGTVTGSAGCLTFEFLSDVSVTGPGWTAAIGCATCVGVVGPCLPDMGTCLDSVCMGNFFDDGGSGANYGDNQNLSHTICSDNGNCVKVDFGSFDIEPNFDFLTVYDGPSSTFPVIGTYTGTNSPGTLLATSGCLTFDFSSDASINFAGWDANISCASCPCLPNMTNCTDSVCSGNFFDPGGNQLDYFNNLTLVHTICSDVGSCTQVDFSSFQLENGFDTLWIYDGASTAGVLIGAYTGTNTPGTVSSTTGCLTFEFISDGTVAAPGWESSISCVPCGACPGPNVAFTPSVTNLSVNFADGSTVSGNASYAWDFGDGNSSNQQNPTHIYATPGTYTVCLTVTDSCDIDTLCQPVTVTCPLPNPAFTHTSNLGSVSFTDASTGTGIFGWDWDFGDGNVSTQTNPTHTYASPGTYTVCLTVRDQCGSDSTCQTVVVSCPLPTPAFSASNSFLTATFTDLSTGNGVQSWFWTFGDGNASSLQNPTHTYLAQGTYTVCLLVTDSCGTDSVCQNLLINCPDPTAGFTSSTSLFTANFTNTSTGTNINGYSWDFGDGNTSTQTNPSHTYAAVGTYTVCLIVTDTCGADTSCQSLTIGCPNPMADFNYSVSNLTATFSDISTGTSISAWSWDFGDGTNSSLQNPVHTYTSGGTYTVCLTITDACGTDTSCKQVSVGCPALNAAFNTNLNGLNAAFTDLSVGSVTSWQWDFGDGNGSTQTNPNHIYATAGTYTVCLAVSDGCSSDTTCTSITTNAGGCTGPVGSFTSSVNGLTVSFTDLTT
ncbi:MAG: PKD domain-containing protein, partial [Bacteroidota bacterium]